MGKLTVKAIQAIKATGARQVFSDGGGLELRAAPDASLRWYVRFSLDGKQLAAPLGFYHDRNEGGLSLESARARAREVRELAAIGVDFRDARAEAQQAKEAEVARERAASVTVRAMYAEWTANGVKRTSAGMAELKRRFEKDVLPQIGAKPVRAVAERDVMQIVRGIADRGAYRMALSVRDLIAQLFAWGGERMPWRPLIEVNPAASIADTQIVPADYEEGADTRALSDAEVIELRDRIEAIKAAYHAAPDKRRVEQPLAKSTTLAIWAMLSTVCRVGELARARREHFDLDARTWYIPPEHSKNGDDLTIYLSDFALDVFRALLAIPSSSPWLFPSPNDPARYNEVKSITKQIGDRQCKGQGAKRAKCRDSLILSGGAWTPHDLRRTGATMMQALDIDPAIIDLCLNHREQRDDEGRRLAGSAAKLRRTYQRHKYEKKMREAWRALGAHLSRLLHAHEGGNVRALRRA